MKKQENVEKTRYSDAELEEFRQIIEEKLEAARREYNELRSYISNTSGNDVTDTSPTYKAISTANVLRSMYICSKTAIIRSM